MAKSNKAVQGTNDSSIISKCSMVSMGYFQDEAVALFKLKSCRRSPLINRGYYIRAKALDKTVTEFVRLFQENCQILSLGAGFDSTFFRLSMKNQLPSNIQYYEIDFPEVVKRKCSILLNSDKLTQCFHSSEISMDFDQDIALHTAKYNLIGVNLKDLKKLNMVLKRLGIQETSPTLIISECVLSYLDTESGSDIIRWAAEKFTNAVFATYEQIHPNDGFGKVMMNHFQNIGSPLRSVEDFPEKSTQVRRYISNGWEQCKTLNMNQFARLHINEEEQIRVGHLEPFDEFEEWHLKCNHYLILWATKGDGKEAFRTLLQESFTADTVAVHRPQINWKHEKNFNLLRFGHSCVLYKFHLFTYGGFGVEEGRHTRLQHLHCMNPNILFNSSRTVQLKRNPAEATMHQSAILLNSPEKGMLIFGGRTSPNKGNSNLFLIPLSQLSLPNYFETSNVVTLDSPCRQDNSNELSESLSCQNISQLGEIPSPRWRHSATRVTFKNIEWVIVFGGRSAQEDYLNDCYLLNTETWTWQKINFQYEQLARHSHACAEWNDKVIISCGLGKGWQPLNEIEVLNCFEMQSYKLPIEGIKPRYSHTSHIIKDKLYLIGGVNCSSEELPEFTVIDLVTLTVEEFLFPKRITSYPLLMHNHCSVYDEESEIIFIVGGGGNCFSFGTHFNRGLITINIKEFIQADVLLK